MIARQGKMIDWLLLAPLPYQSDGMRHVATGFNKSALDTAPIIFALLDLSGSLHQRVFFFRPLCNSGSAHLFPTRTQSLQSLSTLLFSGKNVQKTSSTHSVLSLSLSECVGRIIWEMLRTYSLLMVLRVVVVL